MVKKGNFEEYCAVKDGKYYCKLCEETKCYEIRSSYLRHIHMRLTHNEEYNRAQPGNELFREDSVDDVKLRDEFVKFSPSQAIQLESREFYGFQFNPVRKILDFAFTKLNPQGIGVRVGEVEGYKVHSVVDYKLPAECRLSSHDFRKLPFGMHQGHALARMFFTFSTKATLAASLTSLTAPQHPKLNDGFWKTLEKLAIRLSCLFDVWVIAGNQGSKEHDGNFKMAIPETWYMILIVFNEPKNQYNYTAFIFPNEECTNALANYRSSINEIWALSGYNFLHSIKDNLQETDLINLSLDLSNNAACISAKDSELAEKDEKIKSMHKQLEKANKRNKNLDEQVTELEYQKWDLQEQVSRLISEKENLEHQLIEAKKNANLPLDN